MAKLTRILLTPHHSECAYFNGFNDSSYPWTMPRHEYLQRDTLGRKIRGFGRAFVVFQCNDTGCPASLAIPEIQVAQRLGLTRGPGNIKEGKK